MLRRNKALFGLGFFCAMCVTGVIGGAEGIVYDSGGRRDPFIKPEAQTVVGTVDGGATSHLEGIIYDPNPNTQSFAIFGGTAYMTGENVGDATIVKIRKDYVVVSVNGEERTLRFQEGEKPRPARAR